MCCVCVCSRKSMVPYAHATKAICWAQQHSYRIRKKEAVMLWLSRKQKGETSVGDMWSMLNRAEDHDEKKSPVIFLFHVLFLLFACARALKKHKQKSYKIISQTFKVAFVLHISSHISISLCGLWHFCIAEEMWRKSVGKSHKIKSQGSWLVFKNTQRTRAQFST